MNQLITDTEKQKVQFFTNTTSNLAFIDTLSITKSYGSKLPIISLFTGAGGMDIGLENAGFKTVACVENDKDCIATIQYNRKEWNPFISTEKKEKRQVIKRAAGDIKMIDAEELLLHAGLKKGEAALVVGGAPCQPYSNIGKKLGKNDQKNGDLFLEFVRIVKGVSPHGFIFENVSGIAHEKHQEVINYMKSNLAGLGYKLTFSILNAADYGVPQKRERFFLIGLKKAKRNPALPLPTNYRSENDLNNFIKKLSPTPKRKINPWITVGETLNNIPEDSIYRPDYAIMNVGEVVKNRMKYIKQGQNFKVLPMELRPNCWKNGKHQGQDTFGRLEADQPSVTIRTAAYNPTKGKYIHPYEHRGLNTIELAALQGFPSSWIFRSAEKEIITLVSGGRQIGNAVPPPLAEHIGKALFAQIRDSMNL